MNPFGGMFIHNTGTNNKVMNKSALWDDGCMQGQLSLRDDIHNIW